MAEYTGGKWVVDRHIVASDKGDAICVVYEHENDVAEANAQLICSAVNACISLNKENPLAVAEGMKRVIDICKEALELSHNPEVESLLMQALALIERGK